MAKRLAVLVVPVLVLVSSALAQGSMNSTPVNQLSATVGKTFVSTQTIQNPPAGDVNPDIHFGNPWSLAFNYGRLLKTHSIFGLYAELPVAMFFRMDLNTGANLIPKDIGALFVTPSARLNFFPANQSARGLAWAAAMADSGKPRCSISTMRTPGQPAPIPVWSSSEPDWMCGSGIALDFGLKRATSTPELPP